MKPRQPSELLGTLFIAVQERGLFTDSKTFADAVPRRDVAAILSDWETEKPRTDVELRDFVDANFTLANTPDCSAPEATGLAEYIAALWPKLTREPVPGDAEDSLLPLPRPYVVPGGRFRELYYWDSYFTMLGLARSGRQDLVEDMIADFGSLIDRYGHIPNGTRSYYLTRSHPPFFYLMAALSTDRSAEARRRRLNWMRAEYAFWMDGGEALPNGGEHRRVVRLADGALLNRYWDDRAAPRDESWREDVDLARRAPERDPEELWRDIRAAAESGWDFSSRWLGDGVSLETIRTTRLIPIDLNALLFGLEEMIVNEAKTLGDNDTAKQFAQRAGTRRQAIQQWLWNDKLQHYADYDLDANGIRDELTAASAFALFVGVASHDRASATAQALQQLLHPGGLMTTLQKTDQQWDAPNGWAPLQWVATVGLRRYGQDDFARRIAKNWTDMVANHFVSTGQLLEKYDVAACRAGGGGEYGTEIGFGWTNGVTLEYLSRQC